MNKPFLKKGLKKMSWFLLCCFIGPVIVHQAFKNQDHPFFIPVLILGMLFLILAFYLGFSGIKTLVNALLGQRKTKL
ncbi:MAG: DUF6095 family protein [Bacteroidetes bacterium]|jgi:hypothetical protein|nr:DUF6095 family protein [Bacteroidota bacterium]MDA0936639.1 DUF6095 family protein [Bacteroidota bacterium]